MNWGIDPPAPRKSMRDFLVRRPRSVWQWAWLLLCLAWIAFALYIVIWTTVYTWNGAHPDEDFVYLGQFLVAAPASWIAILPAFFLPQQPIGPNGGGGIGDGAALALQVLTCVLVVVQGWLVYLLGMEVLSRWIPVSRGAETARTGP